MFKGVTDGSLAGRYIERVAWLRMATRDEYSATRKGGSALHNLGSGPRLPEETTMIVDGELLKPIIRIVSPCTMPSFPCVPAYGTNNWFLSPGESKVGHLQTRRFDAPMQVGSVHFGHHQIP